MLTNNETINGCARRVFDRHGVKLVNYGYGDENLERLDGSPIADEDMAAIRRDFRQELMSNIDRIAPPSPSRLKTEETVVLDSLNPEAEPADSSESCGSHYNRHNPTDGIPEELRKRNLSRLGRWIKFAASRIFGAQLIEKIGEPKCEDNGSYVTVTWNISRELISDGTYKLLSDKLAEHNANTEGASRPLQFLDFHLAGNPDASAVIAGAKLVATACGAVKTSGFIMEAIDQLATDENNA